MKCQPIQRFRKTFMFSCFRKMAEKDREVLVKLNDIEHYISVKGYIFTGFKHLLELGKLNGVQFQPGL